MRVAPAGLRSHTPEPLQWVVWAFFFWGSVALASALDNLTEKQRQFVLHYLEHFNSARAAREAGYSEKSDYSIGSENLRKPEIAQAISEELEKRGITPERVKCVIAEMAFSGDMAEFEPWLTGKKTLAELKADGVNTALLHSIGQTDKGRSLKTYSRLDAAKELDRVLGIVTEHRKVEVTGGVDLSKMSQEELERQAHAAGLKEPTDGNAGGRGRDANNP